MRVLEVALAIALLLALLPLLVLAVRRRVLQRAGGAVELSLRLSALKPGRGWALGVGHFQGDELRWYRVFSVGVRPRRTLLRRELHVTGRRSPGRTEALALLDGAVVMECTTPSGPVELAMSPSAVTGFLAWLESAPPGPAARR